MLATVGALGREVIMSSAEQPHVIGFGAAAFAERPAMVELEPGPAAAANAARVDPAAAEAVAFEHGAASRARDVGASRLGRCGRRR